MYALQIKLENCFCFFEIFFWDHLDTESIQSLQAESCYIELKDDWIISAAGWLLKINMKN